MNTKGTGYMLLALVLSACSAAGATGDIADDLTAIGMHVSGDEAVSPSGRTIVVFDDAGVTAVAARSAGEYEALEIVAERQGLVAELDHWINFELGGGATYRLSGSVVRIVVDPHAVRFDVEYGPYTPLADDHRWVDLTDRVTATEAP